MRLTFNKAIQVSMTEPLLILIPILVLVGFFDLRYMRIPNALSWALLVLFGATFLFTPTSEFLMHILAGLTVLCPWVYRVLFSHSGGGRCKNPGSFGPVHSLARIFNFCQRLFCGDDTWHCICVKLRGE